ncbi:MAG: hypothetical protein KUL74_03840 [Cloacibacterium sp.]|nr:hypothetical protein [Cloacibacterium sp.]
MKIEKKDLFIIFLLTFLLILCFGVYQIYQIFYPNYFNHADFTYVSFEGKIPSKLEVLFFGFLRVELITVSLLVSVGFVFFRKIVLKK